MFLPSLAWRDSRGLRGRLLLYVSATALGVAALVALRAFGANLDRALGGQAADLLGADLTIEGDAPFSAEIEALLDSVATVSNGARAREVTVASIALGRRTGQTRLVQVRAVEGPYPFYGRLETTPTAAGQTYQARGEAVADAGLLLQLGLGVGDSLTIGRRTLRVAGQLDRVAGRPDIGAIVGPRVYVPLAALDTSLLGFGSRAGYAAHLRLGGADAAERALETIEPRLDAAGLRATTTRSAEGDWAEALGDLRRFLELVGFVALLLGGIGVASAVGVYVRQKEEAVATLRCLGLPSRGVLAVYAMQAAALGLAGAALGVLLGLGVQALLPRVLGAFLPVEVEARFALGPVLEGLGVGLAFALAFALLPLVGVRRVPPLRALRVDDEDAGRRRFDPLRIALALALAVMTGLFAWAQTGEWIAAVAFPLGLVVAMGVLALAARGLQILARRLVRPGWPYPWRQGVANLHRPGNQTTTLLLTLGLGALLLLTLASVERSLLAPLTRPDGAAARADVILFGVPKYERDDVAGLVRRQGLPVVDDVAVIPMRLTAIGGRAVDDLVADSTLPRWALEREYRSTFRSRVIDSEEVTAGEFVGRVPSDASLIPISVELDLARDLQLELGDRLTWDVGGRMIESEVGSLRRVDWARIQPNFFVVFPEGPLDAAPQFGVLTTRAGSDERSAALQRALVEEFPSVSAVDVRQVLALVDGVVDRVALVLRFMAAFAVGTGLVVLAGAVRVARQARATESVLLRTLGASRAIVRRVLVAEYVALGLLAALTGAVLALAAGWALARFAFDVPFVPPWGWLLGALVAGPLLTVVVGLAGSRGLLERPPLDVLRAEA